MGYSKKRSQFHCYSVPETHKDIKPPKPIVLVGIRGIKVAGCKRVLKRLRSKMCLTQDTYYVSCGHWGTKQMCEPCAAAIGQLGLSRGCWNSRVDGIRRIHSSCHSCQRKRMRNQRSPWDDISVGAWRRINEIRQRERSRRQPDYPSLPWPSAAHPSGLERRRSFTL